MRKKLLQFLLLAAPLAGLSWTNLVTADEDNTLYYEDDAWYDVSEWLDGNDFNPTNEVFGEWDDEGYNWGSDRSNVIDEDNSGYGYDGRDLEDDWYYDFSNNRTYTDYGTVDSKGRYSYSNNYYDHNNDGYYDATSSQFPEAEHGVTGGYAYYLFEVGPNDPSSNNQTANGDNSSKNDGLQSIDRVNQRDRSQQQVDLKQYQIKGQVQKTKKMKVRNGPQRLIAQVSAEQGRTYVIDLGRNDQFGQTGENTQQSNQSPGKTLQLREGDQISANGPMMKVGDKQVLLAQAIKVGNGQEHSINRTSRTVDGKITKLKTTKVRGHECQMVILELDSGKQALVDLGRSDKLNTKLTEGDQIQVSGVPVKVKDRSLLLANSITKNGEQLKIERSNSSMKSKPGT